MKITEQNFKEFPVGTKLIASFGCPVDTGGGDWPEDAKQNDEGVVTGYLSYPHTLYPTAHLMVKTIDGEEIKVSEVGEVGALGIGWSLAPKVFEVVIREQRRITITVEAKNEEIAIRRAEAVWDCSNESDFEFDELITIDEHDIKSRTAYEISDQ